MHRFFSRAPADCRQYFTGTAGTVKSYNYGGSLMLAAQQYTNCFRQELGDNLDNEFLCFTYTLCERHLIKILQK
jgi:hypothetical protein